ncbi:MAG: type II toxin-antitoxin system ParD family antitoxin [Desulfobulbus sp.]|nr:type II toxin-antitoxin system ParD family antitoxin [Desulfobulbus sp.]
MKHSLAQQVAEGRYGTASEAIRAGMRLLEEREIKLEALLVPLGKAKRADPPLIPSRGLLKSWINFV